jgi:hypothetical protein
MASIVRLVTRPLWPLKTASASCVRSVSFKSDLHTDKLYPGSDNKDRLAVKKVDPSDHPAGFNGVINISELKVFVPSIAGSSLGGGGLFKVLVRRNMW